MTQKTKWEKPKLIILVRGKPEERVLQGCKNYSSGDQEVGQPGSPSVYFGKCSSFTDPEKGCPAACAQASTS